MVWAAPGHRPPAGSVPPMPPTGDRYKVLTNIAGLSKSNASQKSSAYRQLPLQHTLGTKTVLLITNVCFYRVCLKRELTIHWSFMNNLSTYLIQIRQYDCGIFFNVQCLCIRWTVHVRSRFSTVSGKLGRPLVGTINSPLTLNIDVHCTCPWEALKPCFYTIYIYCPWDT